MNDKNITLPGKYLYEENGDYYFRNEQGLVDKVEVNRYYHGQIVKASEKHHSKTQFIKVIDPSYSGQYKKWFYGVAYISMNGMGGGCSYSWPEDEFTELVDADAILYAERLYLKEEIQALQNRLKEANSSLEKIEYALSLSVKNWESMRTKCVNCGAPMARNKTNCNIDKCDACYPELK